MSTPPSTLSLEDLEEKRLYERIVALNSSGEDPAELQRLCLDVVRRGPPDYGPPGEREFMAQLGAPGGRQQALDEMVRRAETSERDMQILVEVVVDVVRDCLRSDYATMGMRS
jgi:hypothetical protein